MTSIKKQLGDKWKMLGSGEALNISTQAASLLNTGEKAISVEEALDRIGKKLNIYRGNIAWLAKNGGGGSGGGGGTTVTEATCKILVSSSSSTNIEDGGAVIVDNAGINVSLTDISVETRGNWTVSVYLNNRRIYTGTASYSKPYFSIGTDSISKYLTNHVGRLTINASYEDEQKGIYGSSSWNGTVTENSMELSASNISINMNDAGDGFDGAPQISYAYSVGYLGDTSANNYRFNFVLRKGSKTISTYAQEIKITDTTQRQYNLNLLNTLFKDVSIDSNTVGVYYIDATLSHITNSDITKTITTSATVVSNQILIASTSLVEWSGANAEYPQVSKAGSFLLDFTAYLSSGGSYRYSVKIGDTNVRSNISANFGTEIQDTISASNAAWAVNEGIVKVELTVKAGNQTVVKSYGIKVVKATNALLNETDNMQQHIISSMVANEHIGDKSFSFSTDNHLSNGVTTSLLSSIDLINGNSLSKVTGGDTVAPYLRLSNGASAVAHNWKVGDDSFSTINTMYKNNNELTISICFKADYHADDDRTILYAGTLNAENVVQSGISIDVHDIYVGGSSVVKLADDTINNVDIVFKKQTTDEVSNTDPNTTMKVTRYVVEVYLDGVVSSIKLLESMPDLGDAIYLGSRYYSDKGAATYPNLCDCNIYNFQVYDTALTPYEIMLKYVNNKALTNYTSKGEPDFSMIDTELKKNFCERDADNKVTSTLFDLSTNTFNINTFIRNGDLNPDVLTSDKAGAIGIPILFIDVSSNSHWTFSAFSAQQSYGNISLDADENAKIEYWDPNGTNKTINTINNVAIELQGHSTLADTVKNLNITIPQNTIFIPREDWFPEQTYTLKADVVDSSHCNNASIGTFINEVLGLDSENSAFLPFSDKAISNVNDSDYKKKQQTGVTLKHTVTGFPVLVLMRFYTQNESDIAQTALGIYSFNLGRDAVRNLGFNKVNSIKDSDGSLISIDTFPYVKDNVTVDETETPNSYWIEIANTTEMNLVNFSNSLSQIGDTSKGDFWQNADSILNERYEVRYPSGGSHIASESAMFKSFVSTIMSLPIESNYYSLEGGNSFTDDVSGDYDTYIFNTETRAYEKDGKQQHMISVSEVNNLTNADSIFNPESFIKYFVVGNMFGLKDNFGKNSTYRNWDNGPIYIDFYDLDSAFDNSNQGEETVGADMWLKYLYNRKADDADLFGTVAETFDYSKADDMYSQETVVSANTSKLWLSLDTNTSRAWLGGSYANVKSVYTQAWWELRAFLTKKAEEDGYAYSDSEHSPITDWFMDKYFINQMKDCGPLLFNYDYKLKYLLQFDNSTEIHVTSAYSKLHGRKIASTRAWLNKHIKFLDSVFYWRDNTQNVQGRSNVNTSGSNTVINTVKAFPVTTNSPVIMYNAVGDNTKSFYFMQQNKKTYVNAGNAVGSGIRNWNLSNSNAIIELGDDETKLKDMSIQSLSYSNNASPLDTQGYPSLTDLDLSGNTTFSSTFNLNAFTQGRISELRSIDLSNTACSDGSTLDLALTFETTSEINTRFTKLQTLDISNSKCIGNLSIPNVPLTSLKIANSSIRSFTLLNQAYLDNVDLTGCSNLQKVILSGCDSYKALSLSNLNELTTVTVSENKVMDSVSITGCKNLSEAVITGNNSLTKIAIRSCTSLKSVTIRDCTALKTLDLAGCTSLDTVTIENSNEGNITTLYLHSTKVRVFNSASNEVLDLMAYTSLKEFSIYGDAAVEYIQFANGDSPIPLNHYFNGCDALKRIYGNVALGSTAMFKDCENFSIHGDDVSTVTYNGSKVTSNGVVNIPVIAKQGTSITRSVTNMSFKSGVTSMNYDFSNTNCTTFDIYYIFVQAANITSAVGAFSRLKQNPFYWTTSVDNSPNRNMFAKAVNLTDLSDCFMSATNSSATPTYIRLFSPTREDEDITVDDGLFSPLTKLQSISRMFTGYTYVIDRFLFRRKEGNYALRNLNWFQPRLVYDEVSTSGYIPLSSSSLASGVMNNTDAYGNMTDFFKNLPDFGKSGNVCNFINSTMVINYDTLKNIPEGCTNIGRSFSSDYATGTITSLGDLFASPSSVTVINAAFRVNSVVSDIGLNVTISNDLFKGMTKLRVFGYDRDDNYGSGQGSCLSTGSLCGGGVIKTIGSTFPYSLLGSCPNIDTFACLFQNATCEADTPTLPYTLFKETPKLKDCSALFYNVNFKYKLTDDNNVLPFDNCPLLERVPYLFAVPAGVSSKVGGMIPSKLFYHGSTQKSITFKGFNGSITKEEKKVDDSKVSFTRYTVVKNSTTYYFDRYSSSKAVWRDANLAEIDASKILESDISFTYESPIRTIIDMGYCFQGADLTFYQNSNPSSEANEEYSPYSIRYDADSNTISMVVHNTYKNTAIWEYDGSNIPTDATAEKYETTVPVAHNYYNVASGSVEEGTTHYFCPPDLFRYCDPNCTVHYIFAHCGHNLPSSSYGNTYSLKKIYGIKGRIPQYLLKPFLKATTAKDLDGMFLECTCLNGYTDGAVYMIPSDFFSYCPNVRSLNSTFEGMTFPENVSLDVFSTINASSLQYLSRVFYRPYFYSSNNSITKISNIFNRFTNLGNVYRAFAATYSNSNDTPKYTAQRVVFDNIFNSAIYTSGAYNTNTNFSQAFAFYSDVSGITRFITKTLPDNTTTNNYATYG